MAIYEHFLIYVLSKITTNRMDINALKYTKKTVFYKMRHSSLEWIELPVWINRRAKTTPVDSLAALHRDRIKIDKKTTFAATKKSLEPDYNSFYDKLPS